MVDHHHLGSDEAKMLALFVEAVLYGVYLVSLGFVLGYSLRVRDAGGSSEKWRAPSGVRAATLSVALILWINSTLNVVLGVVREMRESMFEPGSNLNRKETWMDLAKPYTVIIQTLTADLFLSYRCWIVYGRSWQVALFPCIMSLASLGVFVWIMVIETQLSYQVGGSAESAHDITISARLLPLSIAQFSITTALNVYATSLIVYRIIQMDRAVAGLSCSTLGPGSSPEGAYNCRKPRIRSRLQKILQIIIESALIYTVTSAMAFVTIVKYESNAQYITTALNIIIVGLTFNSIAIRLARENRRVRRSGEGRNTRLTTLRFDHDLGTQSNEPCNRSSERSGGGDLSLTSIHFSSGSEKKESSIRSEIV